MSAIQKEQIYTELRKYHLDEFPDSLSNSDMNDLLDEYRILEDEVISMLLGLVNGKTEYQDLTENVKKFLDKASPGKDTEKSETEDREYFVTKTNMLEHMLEMAGKSSFKIRPIRKTWQSSREVTTKINKK